MPDRKTLQLYATNSTFRKVLNKLSESFKLSGWYNTKKYVQDFYFTGAINLFYAGRRSTNEP